MAMRKKLFVVSDIHGHYTQLMRALEEAGFDAGNREHLLVSCGDLFDRGSENKRVYDFVRGLPQKILIRGNHEDELSDILKQGFLTQNDRWNGTVKTLIELLGEDAVDENGGVDLTSHAEKIREITAWIESMQDYYETDEYVFTHGWLPISFEGNRPRVDPQWRDASDSEWRYAHSLEWQQLYPVGATLEGKTIVCGHRTTQMARVYDQSREPDCTEPFYGKGMIAIDAETINSGRVNVLVLE